MTNLEEILGNIEQSPFKPVILINRSEGYIEAIYKDCSYYSKLCEIGEVYYGSLDNQIVGYRIPLSCTENFDINFK